MTHISANGVNVDYAYDQNGRRVEQSMGMNMTNYLWDEFSQHGDIVLETRYTTSSPVPVPSKAYTRANGQLISQIDSMGTLYFLGDAQNSTP